MTPFALLSLALLTPPALPPGCVARLGETRFRHPGPVDSLAYAPDGRTLVTHAHGERAARVWDAATGTLVGRVAEPRFTRDVTRVVGFTPDGSRLLVENDDDEAVVVRLATGQEVSRWSMRLTTAVSPDGRHAVGVDLRGRATVWRLDTGDPAVAVGTVSDRTRFAAAFSPDGKRVAIAGHTPAVAGEVHTIAGSPGPVSLAGDPVRRLVWLSDGSLAVHRRAAVERCDPGTGRTVEVIDRVNAAFVLVAADPDGRRLIASHDARLTAFEPSSIRPAVVFAPPVAGTPPVAVRSDGRRVAVADGIGVRVYDALTGGLTGGDDQPAVADALASSRDGSRLLAVSRGQARLWDVAAGRTLRTWRPDADGWFAGGTLSPDGRFAAAVHHDPFHTGGRVVVWSADTGDVVCREPTPDRAGPADGYLVGFDPAGRLWVGDRPGATLRAIALPSGHVAERWPTVPECDAGAVAADGRAVVVCGGRATAVRPTAAGEWVVLDRVGFGDTTHPVRPGVSAGGRRAAYAAERDLLVWDLRAGPRRHAARGLLPRATDVFQSLAFSPDGRQLVWTKSGDHLVRFWDVGVWAERYRFEPPGGVRTVALSADGRRLAVGHPDGTATVWDAAAVEEQAVRDLAPVADDRQWDGLASADPAVGLMAVRGLASRPDVAVPLLAARLPMADREQVARWAADLDSPWYAVRERASRSLSALGESAEGAVRRAASTSASAEVRRRADAILAKYESKDGRLPPALLRAFRAVEVLERVGGPEAVAVLRRWAAGEPAAVRTAEAAAAVEWLGGR